MRTIKTYFKGAPFYIASAYVMWEPRFPVNENTVSANQSLGFSLLSYGLYRIDQSHASVFKRVAKGGRRAEISLGD